MNIVELIDKIEKSVKVYNQNGKRAARELNDERSVKHIRSDIKTCLEYGDEKVALAVQTYELVCKYSNIFQKIKTRIPLRMSIFSIFRSFPHLIHEMCRWINTFED